MRAVTLRDVDEDDLPVFFRHQRDPVAIRMAAFTAPDPSDRNAFEEHWARILDDDSVITLDDRRPLHTGAYL